MDKLERLNKAIAYLKGCQKITNQQDIVEAMCFNKTSISQALKGNESYLTSSFLTKFAGVFKEIDREWLLSGKGDMLTNNQTSDNTNNNGIVGNNVYGGGINDATVIQGLMAALNKRDEQIDKLLLIIENMRNQ
jgi:hypothetical protein